MHRLLPIVLSVLPLFVGIYLLVSAVHSLGASERAASWPTVYGTVIESRVGGLYYYGQGSWITYEYEVLAQRYESSRVAFGGGRVRDLLPMGGSRFPIGKRVNVYYNPGDPADAVLEVGLHSGALLKALLGIGLIGVARILWRRLSDIADRLPTHRR